MILDEFSSDDSDSGSVPIVSDGRAVSPQKMDDDDEIQIISNPNIPPHELLKDLQYLRPVTRLPFLRRNLRIGFYLACKRTGIKTDMPPESLAPEVDILYRIQTSEPDISHSTKIRGWCCPFCTQHDTFKTQQMLLIHLKWDHSEFEVECHQVFNFFDAPVSRVPSSSCKRWSFSLDRPTSLEVASDFTTTVCVLVVFITRLTDNFRPDSNPTSANVVDNDTSVTRPTNFGLEDRRLPAEINLCVYRVTLTQITEHCAQKFPSLCRASKG